MAQILSKKRVNPNSSWFICIDKFKLILHKNYSEICVFIHFIAIICV
jgi:hypothetical protein